MALGTNYARNPSLKEIQRFHLKVAKKLYIDKGKTKEEYLSIWKPETKKLGEKYWEIANKT